MMIMSTSRQLSIEKIFHRVKDHTIDALDDLWERFKIHIIWGSTTSMEFFMLFATLLSGLWLILPLNTFSTRGGYDVMELVARWVVTVLGDKSIISTEAVWGAILLVNCVIWARAIANSNVSLRRLAAMMSIIIWSFISACFMLVDFRFLSSVVYPYYTLICIWLYLRAWR